MNECWVILIGDNDIDYVTAFGPFDTQADAQTAADALPSDEESGENLVRVSKLESPDRAKAYFQG